MRQNKRDSEERLVDDSVIHAPFVSRIGRVSDDRSSIIIIFRLMLYYLSLSLREFRKSRTLDLKSLLRSVPSESSSICLMFSFFFCWIMCKQSLCPYIYTSTFCFCTFFSLSSVCFSACVASVSVYKFTRR